MNRHWTILGAILGFIAVMMGAFGAHALKAVLDPHSLQIYQTAAQYQIYHALALIGLGAWANTQPKVSTLIPGTAFVLGIFLFSGSLYGLSLSGIHSLGAITPVGGLAFMVGWLSFAWAAYKS